MRQGKTHGKIEASFQERVVWITGASSGIGESLAYAFSRTGARLILSARNRKALERVKGRCQGDPGRIDILPLDLSRLGSLKHKARSAMDLNGRIDILIHNAGVALRELVKDTDLKIDKRIMAVNYFGPVALTKAVLKPMLERKSGQFVVVSSLSGKFGVPKCSAYSASKHALHGFFESLRAETANNNIHVTLAVPGFVRTQITVNALTGNGARFGQMLRVQAKGLDPKECAAKILKATRRRKEEILIGRWDALSVTCKRLFPRLFSRIIRNHPVKKIEALKRALSLKRHLTEAASESQV